MKHFLTILLCFFLLIVKFGNAQDSKTSRLMIEFDKDSTRSGDTSKITYFINQYDTLLTWSKGMSLNIDIYPFINPERQPTELNLYAKRLQFLLERLAKDNFLIDKNIRISPIRYNNTKRFSFQLNYTINNE